MRLIEVNAQCRHLKKLTCEGILRQVFIRVYRMETQSVMSVFSTQFCELLLLSPFLWFNYLPFSIFLVPPLDFVVGVPYFYFGT
jgi:hypothetical protein